MLKQRREGYIQGDVYVIIEPNGSVIMEIPLAMADAKLKAAIARNGWEPIPEV
jgi:hypothetical protein